MTTAERAEFVRTWKRELSQRSDATSASARSSAAAAAARTVLADRWALTQAADAKRGDRRRVHYLSMEFLMGRAMHNALAALKVDDHWVGWRLASWTALPRWACPPSATACATSTACSPRSSRTAGRSSSPTNGCATAARGS
jgi:hypothetical protein